MQFLDLRNKKILNILNQYTGCLDTYTQSIEKHMTIDPSYFDRHIYTACPVSDSTPGIDPTSDGFLKMAMQLAPNVYTRASRFELFDFMRVWDYYESSSVAKNTSDLNDLRIQAQTLTNRLKRCVGLDINALSAYYPDNGYIGWHHNGDAWGWNILFTYSQDGNGFFKYRDIDSGEIVTLPDKKGWSCKVGFYPPIDNNTSPEQLFWHTARTTKKRYTLAFVFKEVGMWETIRDIIEVE
jgi:hypothetical protein